MLICKAIQDKNEQKRICGECDCVYIEEALAYSAVDGKLLGVAQFSLKEDGGHLYNINEAVGTHDVEALFVLGRAVMNFVDLLDEKNMYYDGCDEKIARMLGFKKNEDGRYYINMTGLFDSPCSCGAQ
ncbi:MAG: hypothetical protein IKL81_05955 [Clostridia bacterium]|nr:hypothetical protein [Clostridia bacterium]